MSVEAVASHFPSGTDDRDGWARDLVLALQANRIPIDVEHVCSVIAVAEQESGVTANPKVANLPAIAKRALEEKAKTLGPLGPKVIASLLDAKAPGSTRTFAQRIETLKTESDLDLLFRELLEEHQRQSPVLYFAADVGARLFSSGSLEAHNPVTTAGSMQVSVRFAQEHAKKVGHEPARARDELYTRSGGLLYGSARLWSFEADYDEMKFRFADYNAGEFASRNAAMQEQVAQLSKMPLALDGDWLAYDADGDVKSTSTHSMEALRSLELGTNEERDAKKEKRRDFEQTRTWGLVKAAWEKKFKKPPAYARLPEVELKSSKMSRPRSTAWFAESVDRRYQSCLKR